MAAGALVPHTLPDGRTIMVPDYLAPKGLAMPSVPKPQAPDMRVAGPGGGLADSSGADPMAAAAHMQSLQPSAQEQQTAGIRAALGPAASSNEHKPRSADPSWMPSGAAKGGKVDPSTLARPKARASDGGTEGEQKPGVDPLVQRVIDEKLRGGRGGSGKAPGMVTASIQESREPGKQLLPEIMWRNGLAERPDFGQEIDPSKPFDAENPAMLDRKTELERGAEAAAGTAGKAFDQQEILRREQANLAKQQLADQSNLMDQQLSTIAQRRDRIARLQETADKRMEEANSAQPRTREEIWQSKGLAANVLGIIGMAIGGYTQGLGRNGGHNPAMEMINKVIDGAVDDERYKAESRKKLGMEAKNDYEKALALYGDTDMAALETKGRKLSNIVAMTQQMLADRGLDESAKQRGLQVQNEAYDQYLAVKQQLADMVSGHVVKQEVNYKPGVAGGGGGANTTLAALKAGAEAEKARRTIYGEDGKPKLNPTEEAAMNAEEADMLPLKDMLKKYRNADSIPGVGGRNIISKGVRGLVDTVAGEGSGSRAMDSNEERANRIIVERAALAYRHKMTGAGGSAKEMEGIDQAFAGARTKEDLEQAVRVSEAALAERRRLAAGGRSTAGDAPRQAASEEPGQ